MLWSAHAEQPGGPTCSMSTTSSTQGLGYICCDLVYIYSLGWSLIFSSVAVLWVDMVSSQRHAVLHYCTHLCCHTFLVGYFLTNLSPMNGCKNPCFFPLFRKSIVGIVLCIVAIAVSCISTGLITYINNYPSDFPVIVANLTMMQEQWVLLASVFSTQILNSLPLSLTLGLISLNILTLHLGVAWELTLLASFVALLSTRLPPHSECIGLVLPDLMKSMVGCLFQNELFFFVCRALWLLGGQVQLLLPCLSSMASSMLLRVICFLGRPTLRTQHCTEWLGPWPWLGWCLPVVVAMEVSTALSCVLLLLPSFWLEKKMKVNVDGAHQLSAHCLSWTHSWWSHRPKGSQFLYQTCLFLLTLNLELLCFIFIKVLTLEVVHTE